jgi:hypothetical protein
MQTAFSTGRVRPPVPCHLPPARLLGWPARSGEPQAAGQRRRARTDRGLETGALRCQGGLVRHAGIRFRRDTLLPQ